MGKNLKGKEIGKGIVQKKDGKYLARFTSRSGKRIEKTFSTVPEAQGMRIGMERLLFRPILL